MFCFLFSGGLLGGFKGVSFFLMVLVFCVGGFQCVSGRFRGGVRKFLWVSMGFRGFQGGLEGFKGFRQVLEGFRRFSATRCASAAKASAHGTCRTASCSPMSLEAKPLPTSRSTWRASSGTYSLTRFVRQGSYFHIKLVSKFITNKKQKNSKK